MFWGPQLESYFEVIWRFWVRMRSDWRGPIFWQHEVPVMTKMNDFVATFTNYAAWKFEHEKRKCFNWKNCQNRSRSKLEKYVSVFLFVAAHDSLRTNLSGCSDLAELPLPRIFLSQYLSKRLKIQSKASNFAFRSKNRVGLKRIGASLD